MATKHAIKNPRITIAPKAKDYKMLALLLATLAEQYVKEHASHAEEPALNNLRHDIQNTIADIRT